MFKDFFAFNIRVAVIWWCECVAISLFTKFVLGKDMLWECLTDGVGLMTTIAVAFLLAIVCWGEYED